MGQPISHSTNRGFKTRVSGEDLPPGVQVVIARREQPQLIACPPSVAPLSLPHASFISLVSAPLVTVGVAHNRVAPVRESTAPGWLPQLSEFSARGVGHINAAFGKSRSPFLLGLSWFAPLSSVAVGVGQDEKPLPDVRRARFGRRKHVPLRIEPEYGQVPENGVEATSNKSR